MSKHQRGSQSEGILPCPSFANGIAESASDRALAERLIECFESIQVSDNHRVMDYSISNVIPLNVTFEGDVRDPEDVICMPARWLALMHFNVDMPWYHNVKIVLKNSTIRVKENGVWVQRGFNLWAADFVRRTTMVIFTLCDLDDDEKADVVRWLSERRREVFNSVKRGVDK